MTEMWKWNADAVSMRATFSVGTLECFGDALRRGELSLDYQPYFDLLTGAGRGAEALARWRLASGRSVAPQVFVPLAERTGQIHAMGAWVLRAACDAARTWFSGGPERLTLSVNVSALQVNREFGSVIRNCLKYTSLPAAQLELEITESTFFKDMALSIECLHEWKQIGIQIALDDFGTGYSSMDYLSRLPIDRLKLDRSLVRHLGVEKKSAIVLRSIITLGAELGLDVIAEGVETELQLQMLRDLGCPRAQGFLLGRPMSAQRAFATVSKPWGNRRAPDLRHPSPAVQAVPCVRARSLTQILGENALICERLQQAVDELSARRAPSGSESVDDLLRDAVGRMAVVNRALEDEIRDRTMADHQLAAALEQEAGSRQAALHDHLTGLPNRVLFNDRLEHALAHARRHGWILAVMFVDLDDFKNINDTHGHRAGDEVLKIIAQRLTQNTRNDDTISRYGGDEYLCLLTPLGETCEMAVIAAQILLAIQAPCEVQGGDGVIQLNLQASIGIAMFPKDGATAAALVASADDAMYRAKKSGIGVEFAQDGRQPGDRAAAYRPDARVDVTSSHAPTLVSDVKPSRNHPALPLTGGLAVRTH